DRAGRRKHRDRYRLAFVSSKFRLGEEPDPFALELDFTTEPWSMRDVTADLVAAGESAARETAEQATVFRTRAVQQLRAEVGGRPHTRGPGARLPGGGPAQGAPPPARWGGGRPAVPGGSSWGGSPVPPVSSCRSARTNYGELLRLRPSRRPSPKRATSVNSGG